MHLQELLHIRDRTAGAAERLSAVLAAYAMAISRRPEHDNDVAGMLHHGEHVAAAHQHLREFVQELIAEAAEAGAIRRDVPAGELAAYCIHALAAATNLHDPAAIHRLIRIIVAGIGMQHTEQL